MCIFILHNNNASLMHFYLREVMNASSDSDARKFDNGKKMIFEFKKQFL